METCSQISSKHSLKKLSVDAGFQKAKVFFKMDVLYKTVKRQDKFWTVEGAFGGTYFRYIYSSIDGIGSHGKNLMF